MQWRAPGSFLIPRRGEIARSLECSRASSNFPWNRCSSFSIRTNIINNYIKMIHMTPGFLDFVVLPHHNHHFLFRFPICPSANVVSLGSSCHLLILFSIHNIMNVLEGSDFEFLELYNTAAGGTPPIQLAQVSLLGAINYTFPAGTPLALFAPLPFPFPFFLAFLFYYDSLLRLSSRELASQERADVLLS